MDKKTLYDKAEKAINQAFEASKQAAKIVSEKAGEAAHITKLLIEKAALEHRVSKKFAELGNCVYEKSQNEGTEINLDDSEISNIIAETKKLDSKLSQVEASIAAERRGKKSKR